MSNPPPNAICHGARCYARAYYRAEGTWWCGAHVIKRIKFTFESCDDNGAYAARCLQCGLWVTSDHGYGLGSFNFNKKRHRESHARLYQNEYVLAYEKHKKEVEARVKDNASHRQH